MNFGKEINYIELIFDQKNQHLTSRVFNLCKDSFVKQHCHSEVLHQCLGHSFGFFKTMFNFLGPNTVLYSQLSRNARDTCSMNKKAKLRL